MGEVPSEPLLEREQVAVLASRCSPTAVCSAVEPRYLRHRNARTGGFLGKRLALIRRMGQYRCKPLVGVEDKPAGALERIPARTSSDRR